MPIHGASLDERVQEFLRDLLRVIEGGKRSTLNGRGRYSMHFDFNELSLLENVILATLRDIYDRKWEHYKGPDPFRKHGGDTDFEQGNFRQSQSDFSDKFYEQAKRDRERRQQWYKPNDQFKYNSEDAFKIFEGLFRASGMGAEFDAQRKAYEDLHQGWQQSGPEEKAKAPPKGRSARHWSEVLCIPRNSNRAQIKRAYRILAAKNHPDRGGDTNAMQEINRAKAEAFEAVGI